MALGKKFILSLGPDPEDAIDEKDRFLTEGVGYARECLEIDINRQLNLATLLGRWSTEGASTLKISKGIDDRSALSLSVW